MNKVDAQVIKIFPIQEKITKSGDTFQTQLVLIEFNQEQEYPSRIVLHQSGEKGIKQAEQLKENAFYTFNLNFRANKWKNPETEVETAFGTISAWRIDPIAEQASSVGSDYLPY